MTLEPLARPMIRVGPTTPATTCVPSLETISTSTTGASAMSVHHVAAELLVALEGILDALLVVGGSVLDDRGRDEEDVFRVLGVARLAAEQVPQDGDAHQSGAVSY